MSEPDDASASEEAPDSIEDRRPDPRVGKYRPDPSEPPAPVRTLHGFWGDSDRPGFRRLYFSASLNSYAEFRVSDVLEATDVPPNQAPFLGEQVTRVTLRRDAQVDITHSRTAGTVDAFDLDVRFGTRRGSHQLNELSASEPCMLPDTGNDVGCSQISCATCFGNVTCCDYASCDNSCMCPTEPPCFETTPETQCDGCTQTA